MGFDKEKQEKIKKKRARLNKEKSGRVLKKENGTRKKTGQDSI